MSNPSSPDRRPTSTESEAASAPPLGARLENGWLSVLAPAAGLTLVAWAVAGLLDARFGGNRESLHIFFYKYLTQDGPGAVLTLGLLALGLVGLRGWGRGFLDRVVAWVDRRPGTVALLVVVVLAAGARLVYHAHPLSMDEYSVVFQARIFAAGQWKTELPQDLLTRLIPPGFWETFFIVSPESGTVIQSYWPGFSLMLVPFLWIGAPWLLNPVLTGVSVWLLHLAARRLFPDSRAGAWAVLLAVASPAFTVNGMSYYTMTAHMLLNLAFAVLLFEPQGRRAFWAGVIGSLALTIQHPVPHAFFALPWFLWLVSRRDRWRTLTPLVLGYFPLSLLLGVGWFRARIAVRGGSGETPGLLERILELVREVFSTPGDYVVLTRALGFLKLHLWAAPGLLVIAILGCWVYRRRQEVQLLTLSALTLVLGYLFVPLSQGHGWGFRFFHYAWAILPLLGAGLICHRDFPRSWRQVIGVCTLASLLFGNALRFHQVEGFISRHLARLPTSEEPGPKLYLISPGGFYTADLVQNDPMLRSKELKLMSLGPARDRELMERFFRSARLIESNETATLWAIPEAD